MKFWHDQTNHNWSDMACSIIMLSLFKKLQDNSLKRLVIPNFSARLHMHVHPKIMK